VVVRRETINRNVYILGKDQPTRVNARREGRAAAAAAAAARHHEEEPEITREVKRGGRGVSVE